VSEPTKTAGPPRASAESPTRPAGRRTRTLSDDRLFDLLERSSRTFALAIPLLPQPTLREVTVAYLLFRIADTFEDASVLWDQERQLQALEAFDRLLIAESPSRVVAQSAALAESCLAEPPTEHAGYLELLAEIPGVLEAWGNLSEEARRATGRHTRRTIELMAGFVRRTDADGTLRLADIEDLRSYCYAVAGIVGEMLTELFLLERPHLESIAGYLRGRAARFGEALQLVNILKDSASDATEGRNYLPVGVERSEIFALARSALGAAAQYCRALQRAGGPDGIVAFTTLPVELAWATLDTVERDGPGAKITRDQVFAFYEEVLAASAEGRPVLADRPALESAPESD
jgi:farnesyl-diphosphate farnesyltransferase